MNHHVRPVPPGAHGARAPALHRPCLACDLREHFPGTPLASAIQTHHWPAHALVYRQQGPILRLHTVCSGLGALQRLSEHGQERTIRLVEPGDVMGLEGLVGLSAQSNAITLLPTHTCSVPLEALLNHARQDAWLSQTLHVLWMAALQRADFVIAELSTGSARARVARLLLHLTELCGAHGTPDLPRSDMASLMGLTVETVSRTMATLQRDGLVSHRQGLLLCQPEQLKAESVAG